MKDWFFTPGAFCNKTKTDKKKQTKNNTKQTRDRNKNKNKQKKTKTKKEKGFEKIKNSFNFESGNGCEIYVRMFFFDFSKVFDLVYNTVLLCELGNLEVDRK